MKSTWIALLTGGVLMHSFAFADVSYQETTQITGGSMMGMVKMAGAFSSQAKQATAPTTSNIMIQGSRMVTSNPHNTEVIDLDQQTITFIDHDKHSYSVVTFQQLKQQMADAAAKVKGQKNSGGDPSQLSFSAHITSTGATRQLEGQTAKESLLTITMIANTADANSPKAGMAATTEMWLIKDAPGMAEMRRFNERMVSELAVDMSANAMSTLLATQPGAAQALEELKKEGSKVSGLPVLQVTRVGVSADGQPLPAPSVAPLPQAQTSGPSGSGVAQQVAVGTATQEANSQVSRLGMFGRALGSSSMSALAHHPSSTPAPAQPTAGSEANAAAAGVLMESQTQTSGFSVAPVDAAAFQVPSGYKQVASPMAHK